MQVTVQNGNKEVTIKITGNRQWEGGENVRTYFDLDQNNKRIVIGSLYEILAGSTRDATVKINGRTFGYKLGIDCNSNTKQAAALEGLESLIAQITA